MNKSIYLTLAATILVAHSSFSQPSPAVLGQGIETLMRKWNLPAGAVAVVREGKLSYSRGFGELDPGSPMPPDALFRVGSLSKPITATAIMKLVEQGRLDLDERVFQLLPQYSSALGDPRMRDITVRHLLQHSAGWDLAISGDPTFPEWETLTTLGASLPPDHKEIIRYWLQFPLDFEPGSKHVYSNFGFVLLGRLIETITGLPYEDFVRQNVIAAAHQGDSLLSGRRTNEARYFDTGDAPTVPSVFSEELQLVPEPYGGFSLALLDSAGGWTVSAPALALFQYQVAEGKLLRPESIASIIDRPSFTPADAQTWYGLGWNIIPFPGGHIWQHAGALAGSVAVVLHVPGLFTVSAVFNTRPADYLTFLDELQEVLIRALAAN